MGETSRLSPALPALRNMFCKSCGTPNTDTATACRVCGESLTRKPNWMQWLTALRKGATKGTRWLVLVACVLSGAVGFAIYYYRATQEFEITGELLYKNENDVRPVAGAYVQVFEDARKARAQNGKYLLLLERQLYLSFSPESYSPTHDAELTPLALNPLSKIRTDWFDWESERLSNCMYAERLFREELKNSLPVATTSTNRSGHFWLKLRRGRYIITTMNGVPSYRHLGSEPSGLFLLR